MHVRKICLKVLDLIPSKKVLARAIDVQENRIETPEEDARTKPTAPTVEKSI